MRDNQDEKPVTIKMRKRSNAGLDNQVVGWDRKPCHASPIRFDCRARTRTSSNAFFLQIASPPIALEIHHEDGGVMHEPIDCGRGHGRVGEDPALFAKGLIGRDEQRTLLTP